MGGWGGSKCQYRGLGREGKGVLYYSRSFKKQLIWGVGTFSSVRTCVGIRIRVLDMK